MEYVLLQDGNFYDKFFASNDGERWAIARMSHVRADNNPIFIQKEKREIKIIDKENGCVYVKFTYVELTYGFVACLIDSPFEPKEWCVFTKQRLVEKVFDYFESNTYKGKVNIDWGD